jgi:hypothetical protein
MLRSWFFRIWGWLLEGFAFFPLLMLSAAMTRQSYGWLEFGVHFVELLLTGALGIAAAKYLAWYERRNPHREVELDREMLGKVHITRFDRTMKMTIAVYVICAVLLLTASILFRGNALYGLLDGLVLFACWIRLERSANLPYSSLYSLKEYVISSVVYLATGFFTILQKFLQTGYDASPLIAAFVVLTVSAGVLLNQLNLEQTMERMSHNKIALPKRIRAYNVMLIGGIMLLLAVGFIVRQQLLEFLLSMSLSWFYLFLSALNYLFSFFTSGRQDTPVIPGPSFDEEEALKVEAPPQWGVYILSALAVAAAVYVAIRYGPRAYRMVSEALKGGWERLLRFIRNLFGGTSPEMRERLKRQVYYTDVIEDLAPLDEDSDARFIDKRYFRRSLKNWRKLTDPAERVRKGYGLLLRYAEQSREDITHADTVEEIAIKTVSEPYGFALEQNGGPYEEVRYAGRAPAPEAERNLCADVETVFAKIRR